MNREVAVYKGDQLLCMGTVKHCADVLRVQTKTIQFYLTPTYQRRLRKRTRENSAGSIAVVRLDEDES